MVHEVRIMLEYKSESVGCVFEPLNQMRKSHSMCQSRSKIGSSVSKSRSSQTACKMSNKRKAGSIPGIQPTEYLRKILAVGTSHPLR